MTELAQELGMTQPGASNTCACSGTVLFGSGIRLFEGVDRAAWPWSWSARSRRSG